MVGHLWANHAGEVGQGNPDCAVEQRDRQGTLGTTRSKVSEKSTGDWRPIALIALSSYSSRPQTYMACELLSGNLRPLLMPYGGKVAPCLARVVLDLTVALIQRPVEEGSEIHPPNDNACQGVELSTASRP